MAETRKRQLLFSNDKRDIGVHRTVNYRKPPGVTTQSVIYPAMWSPAVFLKGSQVTVSENHPQWTQRNKLGKLSDAGGEFSTVKKFVECNPTPFGFSRTTEINATTTRTVDMSGYCTCCAGTSLLAFPPSLQSTNSVLDALGAKAIAACKPTNSVVDLSTTLGEIMSQGGISLPVIHSWFNRAADFTVYRDAASANYLSLEFGWKPLVSDIMGFAHGVSQAHKLLKQFERDAGRVVRRRYFFDPIVSETTTVHASDAVPFIGMSGGDTVLDTTVRGQVIRTRKSRIERWFSGAFTYFLPSGYSSRTKVDELAAEADKLLGLQLTPDTLWNLAPWSWAVDWFSSLGAVIDNITDVGTDGLVMRYGYLMEHSIHEDIYSWDGPLTYYRGVPHPASIRVVVESKIRRKANPYGFGLTWSGLSPRQLAILAALGVSRGPS